MLRTEIFIIVANFLPTVICDYRNNYFGISIRDFSNPNLGNKHDHGNNEIKCNTNCDIYNQTQNQILALGNKWDDDIFLFSASDKCLDGANIVNNVGGIVVYQFITSGKNLIFPDSVKVELSMPRNGAIIQTNEPCFEWTAIGNELIMSGVFNRPIIIKNNEIVNIEDLIWAWHSGLGTGLEGDVCYNEGVAVTNGELNTASFPTSLLEKGRTYYWAVWAWDEKGIKITHSSNMFYFTIAN